MLTRHCWKIAAALVASLFCFITLVLGDNGASKHVDITSFAPIDRPFAMTFGGQESRSDISGTCYVYDIAGRSEVALVCVIDSAPGAIAFSNASFIISNAATGLEANVLLSGVGTITKHAPFLILFESNAATGLPQYIDQLKQQALFSDDSSNLIMQLVLHRTIVK